MDPNQRGFEDVENGKLIFQKYCASCHGVSGQGQGYRLLGRDPANLTLPATTDKSDAELLATIHEGKPNMPPWKSKLSSGDSRDVLAYVKALAR
jgi:mono/diheme cytochrome c family protein